MAPVVPFNVMPVGQVPTCETAAFAPAPDSTAAVPLTVSLAATFAIGVEAVPATAEPVSDVGAMTAFRATVTVAVAQSGGVFLSHS
jgi:hypothetical protein